MANPSKPKTSYNKLILTIYDSSFQRFLVGYLEDSFKVLPLTICYNFVAEETGFMHYDPLLTVTPKLIRRVARNPTGTKPVHNLLEPQLI